MKGVRSMAFETSAYLLKYTLSYLVPGKVVLEKESGLWGLWFVVHTIHSVARDVLLSSSPLLCKHDTTGLFRSRGATKDFIHSAVCVRPFTS